MASLKELVGSENVKELPGLDGSDLQSADRSQNPLPSYIVTPKDTQQIKTLIDWANTTMTPLVPVSSGEPHLKGATNPVRHGSVIVDLTDMKKIINIDRDMRVAVCEPGVTFGELIPAVAEHGLRLNMPLLPKQSKSVVASMLDRDSPMMPGYHWDIADPLNCLEFVFGTGDVFRTGAAAGPGSIEQQWAAGQAQQEGAGPAQASWYRTLQGAQGTLGIASWASLRCELAPVSQAPYLVGSPDLGQLLSVVHWLVRLRLVAECFIMNRTDIGLVNSDGLGRGKDHLESLPPYILFFNTVGYAYLPEERLRLLKHEADKIVGEAGLSIKRQQEGLSAGDMLTRVQKPSGEPYWRLRAQGAFRTIHFLSTHKRLLGLVETFEERARAAGYQSNHVGIYLQPIVQGTSYHCEFSVYYGAQDEEADAAATLMRGNMIDELIAGGAYFSRPYENIADLVYKNIPETTSALSRVKDMFDPNHVMNPGRLCF